MRDFWARLVQRQWGQIPTIQPRLPSVFAPVMGQAGFQETDRVIDATAPLIKEQMSQATLEGRQVQDQESPRNPAAPPVSRLFQPMVESHSVSRVRTEAPESPRVSDEIPLADVRGSQHAHVTEMPKKSEGRQIKDEGRRGDESLHMVPSDIAGSMGIPRLAEPRARDQARTPQQAEAPRSLVGAASSARQTQNIPQTVAEPPVQVTIGRIEVIAVSAPPPPKRTPAARKPAMSLDDYLARRRRRES